MARTHADLFLSRGRLAILALRSVLTAVEFTYPDDGDYSDSMLVKLGARAGGGIGADQDVVAFNTICTHQGGAMAGTYGAAYKSLGPCPLHLSTYDLTRHGILISGQAYQSLPQVLLELEGDDIYAVRMAAASWLAGSGREEAVERLVEFAFQ